MPTLLARVCVCPDEKEKTKINLEELQIKKVKKKKKKKHKEGDKHKQVKMYHRSCQTVCAGLLLLPPSPFKQPLPVPPSHNPRQSHLGPLPMKNLFNSPSSFDHSPASSAKASFRSHPGLAMDVGQEFAPYIHVENQPNGGALVAHAYASQLASLSNSQRQRFAEEFVKLSFSEDSSQVRATDAIPPQDLFSSVRIISFNLRAPFLIRNKSVLIRIGALLSEKLILNYSRLLNCLI